jgi:transposase
MICLEAIQAHRFLDAQRNKTDKNDARGLAQLVGMGEEFIKPVIACSQASQETRAALALRQQLVQQKIAVENMIGGILKAFGLIVQRGHVGKATFRRRVLEKLCDGEMRGINLPNAVTPALALHETLQDSSSLLCAIKEVMRDKRPRSGRMLQDG